MKYLKFILKTGVIVVLQVSAILIAFRIWGIDPQSITTKALAAGWFVLAMLFMLAGVALFLFFPIGENKLPSTGTSTPMPGVKKPKLSEPTETPICLWCGEEMSLVKQDSSEWKRDSVMYRYQYICENWEGCSINPETCWEVSPEAARTAWFSYLKF